MTSPAKPNQLQLDWLDALLVLRRGLEADGRGKEVLSMVDYWEGLSIVPQLDRVMVQDFDSTIADMPNFQISVPNWSTLAKIERLEILLYTATGQWFWRNYLGNPFEAPREAFQNLCFRVGCWHTNTPSVRERWRLIDWKMPAHLLPLASHEDRPKCRLCSIPVATEAGAYQRITHGIRGIELQTIGEADLYALEAWKKLESRQRFLDGGFNYRPDLHEECDRYVHRVMIPMRLEQLKAETMVGDQSKSHGAFNQLSKGHSR